MSTYKFRYLKSAGLVNELFDYTEISARRIKRQTKKFCTSPKCCQYEYIHKSQRMYRLRAKIEKETHSDKCPDCGNYLVIRKTK